MSSLFTLPPEVSSPPRHGDDPASPEDLSLWLDAGVLMCACPSCGAPVSVRHWLMLADCWKCKASIELSEEEIDLAERLLAEAEGERLEREPVVLAPAVIVEPPPPQEVVRFVPEEAIEEPLPEPVAESPAPAPVPQQAPVTQQASVAKPARPSAAVPAPVNGSARTPLRQAVADAIAAPPPAAPNAAPTAASAAEPVRRPARRPEGAGRRVAKAIGRAIDTLPAWLLSAVIHLLMVIVLALIGIGEEPDEDKFLIVLSTEVRSERVRGDEIKIAPDDPQAKFDVPEQTKNETDPVRRAEIEANQLARELRVDDAPSQTPPPPIEMVRDRLSSADGIRGAIAARDPRLRDTIVAKEGGTNMTEAAVARGLRWFSQHQAPDGRWRLNGFQADGKCSCGHHGAVADDTAGTSLALLPFLGAGQTHLTGRYKKQVSAGLAYLRKSQKPDGDLRVSPQSNSGMYAQGQASIVLCEAYAMTGDESLRKPAQRSIDFIVAAQYDDGGWRYLPAPRNQDGDTSVVGWQLMALQSGRAAGLKVPDEAFDRANRFLDTVAKADGSQYAYQRYAGPTPTMTAEGLLCRIYLGWRRDEPALGIGAKWLLATRPPSAKDPDIYYWYYATQAMHHYGGPAWEEWNFKMRDTLVQTQQKEGHAAGSWAPAGQHADAGGRIYMTSLAVCTLEVYYRHLPIFRKIDTGSGEMGP